MIIKIILPLIALSVVIAIHEFGHLIFAKLFKVKVEVFSIGMGKKLFRKTIKNTEFAISVIPLGGYCKLKGGDIENPSQDSDSMDMASPLKKIFIYFAGPLFNIILTGLLIFTVYLLPVHQKIEPIIKPVKGENLPAELAGLKDGDKIISINSTIIDTYNDISENLTSNNMEFIIERDKDKLSLIVTPQNINEQYIIGVYPYIPLITKNNLESKIIPGDKIISINNNIVNDYLEFTEYIDEINNIKIIRNNSELTLKLTNKDISKIKFTENFSYNILDSIKYSIVDTAIMLKRITFLFKDLFKTGEVVKSISSPLRLVYEVGSTVDNIYKSSSILITINSLLSIMASISLTLGFINLFPIPILDGGQILLNLISIFMRKPIGKKFLYGYQTAGLIIVVLLFTLGISNDIFYFGDL